MQAPPPPTRRRGAMARYAPFIVIVIVIAAIAVFFAGRDSDKSTNKVSTGGTPAATKREIPITYNEAKAAGTLGKYTWQKHCDPKTGLVAMPVLQSPPCVPAFKGVNGGATAPGVTADTIRVAFYVAKPDIQSDTLLRATGAYDSPEQQKQGIKDYLEIYKSLTETYGRKIDLVYLQGTGLSTDATAARADAIKAADELHVFAVINGPTQTPAFADELTSRGVMCLGACLIAQPQGFYAAHPGLFGVGPLPEQPVADTIELAAKQLKDKNAIYAGDPAYHTQKRRFALLTYDTPDGQFKPVWDGFVKGMAAAGMPFVSHVSYFLDFAKAQGDARTIVTKLKASGATSVIFSGDPIMPKYFTEEATKQNYHPEWIISGTVYADTDVFARSFDQDQWAHAFGIGIVGPQSPEEQHDDFKLHRWWFGTPPPDINTTGIIEGDADLLLTGIQLAGPKLTVANFSAGIRNQPVAPESPNGLRPILSYGMHGVWPGMDFGGVDNLNLIWWDPKASGPDETGADGKGMYRFIQNGRRFMPGHIPTEPLGLFNPANTITRFESVPAEMQPPDYPTPPH
jgi:Periplasmic binding protein